MTITSFPRLLTPPRLPPSSRQSETQSGSPTEMLFFLNLPDFYTHTFQLLPKLLAASIVFHLFMTKQSSTAHSGAELCRSKYPSQSLCRYRSHRGAIPPLDCYVPSVSRSSSSQRVSSICLNLELESRVHLVTTEESRTTRLPNFKSVKANRDFADAGCPRRDSKTC